MRHLTRRQRAEQSALVAQLERNPQMTGLVVEDYAQSRALVHGLRRRVEASARHPDEPGSSAASDARPWGFESRSNLQPGDGVARYGDPDHTGFCDGAVF